MLPKEGNLTRASAVEYAAAVRGRYLRGSRAEKKMILDEFCQATGYHRKSAIRRLHRVRAGEGGLGSDRLCLFQAVGAILG